MSLTTDKNDPNLHKEMEDGQSKSYLILSKEEREKVFIRPVRASYVHVAIIPIFDNESGKRLGGSYITQKELEDIMTNSSIGGCGSTTTMSLPIAETYARNPKFYGATFCCGCKKHLPVGEFVWEGTDERVGS